MNHFAIRSDQAEMMDDLKCSGPVVRQTLRELEVINAWLGGNKVTLEGVRELIRRRTPRAFTLADLGCGGGDIARLLLTKFEKSGYTLHITGVDANPDIVSIAAEHHGNRIRFVAMDVLSEEFCSMQFDIVTATLFFHHFTSAQLAGFIRQLLTQVKVGIVINDIHRHWFSYHSIRILTGLFSRSPMVRHDAPVSVMRAFTRQEMKDILEAAGATNYTISWRWAFRWQVVIRVG